MTHDVFICHSSLDRTIANAICSHLEQNRIRCWIAPRDVLPGTEYAQSIIEGISGSRLAVLVFSDNSNRSPHVHREIERAVSHGIPILPFRVDDVVPSPALEYFISDAHWLDAMNPPMEQHLQNLVGTVRLLLDRSAGGAVPAPAPLPAPAKRSKWWIWAAIGATVFIGVLITGVVMIGGLIGGVHPPQVSTNSTSTGDEMTPTDVPSPSVTTVKFGEVGSWSNGLQVSISPPISFAPSATAAGGVGFANNLKFTVTLTNDTGKAFDPAYFVILATASNVDADSVFDSANSLNGGPETGIPAGQSVTFDYGFNAISADLVVDVSPNYDAGWGDIYFGN